MQLSEDEESVELEEFISGKYKKKNLSLGDDVFRTEGIILFTEVEENSIKILTGTEEGKVTEVIKFELPEE